MAQHGKDTVFKLDNAAGTLQTLTTYVISISTSWSVDSHDVTTLGNTGHKNAVGLQDNSFDVVFDYADTIYTHLTAIFQASSTKTFEISPKGTTGGYPKESGECNMTSLSINPSATDVLQITASFKVDGAVTFGTN